jgi:hypothetical protein
MPKLTKQEKEKIIELINAGKPLPAVYKSKLFQKDDTEFIEATKDYKLVYKGKARKEDIIAQTPAAPFQLIRTFNRMGHGMGSGLHILQECNRVMSCFLLYTSSPPNVPNHDKEARKRE